MKRERFQNGSVQLDSRVGIWYFRWSEDGRRRSEPMSGMRYPFKSLCNCLGSPDNKGLYEIERHDPKHFTPVDSIRLKSSPKKWELYTLFP